VVGGGAWLTGVMYERDVSNVTWRVAFSLRVGVEGREEVRVGRWDGRRQGWGWRGGMLGELVLREVSRVAFVRAARGAASAVPVINALILI
jgi:hypothetical protein